MPTSSFLKKPLRFHKNVLLSLTFFLSNCSYVTSLYINTHQSISDFIQLLVAWLSSMTDERPVKDDHHRKDEEHDKLLLTQYPHNSPWGMLHFWKLVVFCPAGGDGGSIARCSVKYTPRWRKTESEEKAFLKWTSIVIQLSW